MIVGPILSTSRASVVPQVDFVDINMGCPIDLVCDKGMGAALMGRTRKLRGIIAVGDFVFGQRQ